MYRHSSETSLPQPALDTSMDVDTTSVIISPRRSPSPAVPPAHLAVNEPHHDLDNQVPRSPTPPHREPTPVSPEYSDHNAQTPPPMESSPQPSQLFEPDEPVRTPTPIPIFPPRKPTAKSRAEPPKTRSTTSASSKGKRKARSPSSHISLSESPTPRESPAPPTSASTSSRRKGKKRARVSDSDSEIEITGTKSREVVKSESKEVGVSSGRSAATQLGKRGRKRKDAAPSKDSKKSVAEVIVPESEPRRQGALAVGEFFRYKVRFPVL